jgi:hypothetical protein
VTVALWQGISGAVRTCIVFDPEEVLRILLILKDKELIGGQLS